MDQFVCFILLFSGLWTLSLCVSRQFHFVNEKKNWTEAQRHCRENYTDLATIDNGTEITKINNSADGVWIGLRNGLRTWNDTDKKCVFISLGNSKGNETSCASTLPFICYGKTNTNTNKIKITYHWIEENKTWTEAQSYCSENHTDLASVRNENEYELINEKLKRNAWIGLYSDSWMWSDGSKSTFRNWDCGEPNNPGSDNCVEIKTNGMWNDVVCSYESPFLCYKDKGVLIQEKKTWKEALTFCREHHVDLISVHTAEIQSWVEERAKNASTAHVWLGLRYTCTLDFWFWVSGESVCYQNWARGNGTGMDECRKTGAVPSAGKQEWVSLPENEALNFICSTSEED